MNFRHRMHVAIILGGVSIFPVLGSAWADPRGDVISAAQRCAGITNDRSWLDCYYGAAQPMRSQLGLPPAPAAQLSLVPPPIFAPSQPAYGATAYVAPVAAAPSITAAPAGPPPMPRRRNDGFMSSLFGSSRPVVANMRMTSYTVDRSGLFTVTLSDGEVWVEDSGDENRPQWDGLASHYVVNVFEGAARSYNLEANTDKQFYKVHRVK